MSSVIAGSVTALFSLVNPTLLTHAHGGTMRNLAIYRGAWPVMNLAMDPSDRVAMLTEAAWQLKLAGDKSSGTIQALEQKNNELAIELLQKDAQAFSDQAKLEKTGARVSELEALVGKGTSGVAQLQAQLAQAKIRISELENTATSARVEAASAVTDLEAQQGALRVRAMEQLMEPLKRANAELTARLAQAEEQAMMTAQQLKDAHAKLTALQQNAALPPSGELALAEARAVELEAKRDALLAANRQESLISEQATVTSGNVPARLASSMQPLQATLAPQDIGPSARDRMLKLQGAMNGGRISAHEFEEERALILRGLVNGRFMS